MMDLLDLMKKHLEETAQILIDHLNACAPEGMDAVDIENSIKIRKIFDRYAELRRDLINANLQAQITTRRDKENDKENVE